LRLWLDARTAPQAFTLDCRDEAHAAGWTLWPDLHARLALVLRRDCDSSYRGRCRGVPGHLRCSTLRHDMADWSLGPETAGALEEDAAHLRLGCCRVCAVAREFHSPHDPLAKCGLQYSRRTTGSRGFRS